MVLEIKGQGIVFGVLLEIYVGRGAFSWKYAPSLPAPISEALESMQKVRCKGSVCEWASAYSEV